MDINDRRYLIRTHRGARWPLEWRMPLRACLLLACLGTFALASASTASATTTTCNPNYLNLSGEPAYGIVNDDNAGGSSCLTILDANAGFRVDSTSFSGSTSQADQFTGFFADVTGCRVGPCLEPNYEVQVSRDESALSSWSFNFSSPGNGKYDAIYDLNFDTKPDQELVPSGAEIEIFLNHQNVDLYGPQLPDVTIEGQTYHVFSTYKPDSASSTGGWQRGVLATRCYDGV